MITALKSLIWWIAKRMLATDLEKLLLASLESPMQWQPPKPITEGDRKLISHFLASETGIKVDIAMHNWTQQQMQRAMQVPSVDLHRQVGFALGCRAGWEMAKSISLMGEAQSPNSEEGRDTGPDPLAHLHP